MMDQHFNIPIVLLLSVIPAAIIGVVISVNNDNWKRDPASHPYAGLWATSFELQAEMTAIVFPIASAIAAWFRMKAEGHRRCNRKDMRILAQDVLLVLVATIVFSLYRTFLE